MSFPDSKFSILELEELRFLKNFARKFRVSICYVRLLSHKAQGYNLTSLLGEPKLQLQYPPFLTPPFVLR